LYLDFIKDLNFHYRIDVQPQGDVSLAALTQGMRRILFEMNRKYLGARKFGSFPPERKFWLLGAKQGDRITKGIHYHLLLHSPVGRIDWWNDILIAWSKQRLRRYNGGPLYPLFVKTKSWGHVPCDDLETVPLLRVEPCQNVEASVRYNLREENGRDPKFFILGLNET